MLRDTIKRFVHKSALTNRRIDHINIYIFFILEIFDGIFKILIYKSYYYISRHDAVLLVCDIMIYPKTKVVIRHYTVYYDIATNKH